MIRHPHGDFALFVGELPSTAPKPALWSQPALRGLDQRRRAAARPGGTGQDPVMDLRANDAAWLRLKLDALATVQEERAFEMPMPPSTARRASSRRCGRHRPPSSAGVASSLARCGRRPTPVVDAMFSRAEPRTGISGTLAWAVDVDNPATNEQFTFTLRKSCCPPGLEGSRRRRHRPARWASRQLPACPGRHGQHCSASTCASSTRPGSA